jgi:MFS family permease
MVRGGLTSSRRACLPSLPGGLIGAQPVGALADRYGRKKFLVGLSVVFILAGGLQVGCARSPLRKIPAM